MISRSLLSPHVAPTRAALPLLEKGFRPFFLVGAAFAMLAVPLWLLALTGGLQPGGAFGALQWHAHEMLFGFSTAIIAGFLLTAISNWCGRETVTGWPLAALVGLWLAGRAAMFFATLPKPLAFLLDASFLPALAIVCATPILSARSRRNYGFVGLLFGLALANGAAHWFALRGDLGTVRLAHRFGLNLIVIMLVIMTGRVVPMFTRNATRVSWIRSVPSLEYASLTAVVLLMLCDLLLPSAEEPGVLLSGLAAALLFARMRFWGTRHVARQPLLWILHVGTLFMPLGLALRALAAVFPVIPLSSSLHALTAGAIGCLTLGMMARVSLGHTGRMLEPARSAKWAFVSLTGAALIRVGAPFLPSARYLQGLTVASTLWSAAFLLFVIGYLRILSSARADAR